mmetsp:Transcript_9672/g.20405  ORF Transcript_9672/g.20405 Transcript_9672/m.20405 type:complete len:81 (-) Transcript_9672:556-798(-)
MRLKQAQTSSSHFHVPSRTLQFSKRMMMFLFLAVLLSLSLSLTIRVERAALHPLMPKIRTLSMAGSFAMKRTVDAMRLSE